MNLRDFWYVVALTSELGAGGVLARRVLDTSLAVFRDGDGAPVILEDRCLHRASPLSCGRVEGGRLRCSYHGWLYDAEGRVVDVPSMGEAVDKIGGRCAKRYAALERDGYVYVRLSDAPDEDFPPFAMPKYGVAPYRTVRVVNRFRNDVTNCAENFVDIPHTVFVHPGIFRTARGQRVRARVSRAGGSVRAEYEGETDNLGWFKRFLNPKARKIRHLDGFHMPNVTCVEYVFGPRRHFFITSQSVPVAEMETLVYTDLTFDYGPWNAIAAPLVRWQGQKVIDQDIDILARQGEVLMRARAALPPAPAVFTHTPADVIHVYIESIRKELEDGRDPRTLPDLSTDIEFLV